MGDYCNCEIVYYSHQDSGIGGIGGRGINQGFYIQMTFLVLIRGFWHRVPVSEIMSNIIVRPWWVLVCTIFDFKDFVI